MSEEAPALPIEAHYRQRGIHGVSTEAVTDPSGEPAFALFYPDTLGQTGVRHPIITWGNGTLAQPRHYVGALHQLASWGMVVVASMSKRTGKGHEMRAGVDHLRQLNGDGSSVFSGTLDESRIGAVGHSQGAGGTINAATHPESGITTAVPICLPNKRWVSKGDDYDVAALTCSVLFLGGARDVVIAGPGTLRGFFDRAPAPAGVASLRGAGHNRIQKSGGRYLGYLTAWLRYQLFDDELAGQAFCAPDAEFLRNPAWLGQQLKLEVHPS